MEKMRIMLVEDEPAALAILEKTVETLSLDIEIVAKVRNGFEAKNVIEQLIPLDVVITDVKMPLMDGIQLSEFIYHSQLSIDVVILSGFQEFSFAQKAMSFGVEEYLLKPVLPWKMEEVLKNLLSKRRKIKRDEQHKLFGDILKNNARNLASLDAEINQYRLVCLHIGSYNGLTCRDDLILKRERNRLESETFTVIDGRNRSEIAIIMPQAINIAEVIQALQEGIAKESYVIVFSNKKIPLKHFNYTYLSMLKTIDANHQIGNGKTVELENGGKEAHSEKLNKQWKNIESELEELFTYGKWEALENKLHAYIMEKSEWENLATKEMLQRISIVVTFINNKLPLDSQLQLAVIEDIVLSSVDISDLILGLSEISSFFIKQSKMFPDKIDSYEFFTLVEKFVLQKAFDSKMTLSLVSDHFGISVTSINDLFKKYLQVTFKEFLLKQRMAKAKKMISSHPQKSLKQISEEVGYNDALYFSKVLKKSLVSLHHYSTHTNKVLVFRTLLVLMIIFEVGCTNQTESKNKVTEKSTSLEISVDSGLMTERFTKFADTFSNKHQIDIIFSERAPGNSGENQVVTELLTENASDILLFSSGGLFKTLDPSEYFYDLSNETYTQNYIPAYHDAISVADETYGIPVTNADSIGLIYHKGIYEELALSEPSDWEAFQQNLEAIKEVGIVPLLSPFKDQWLTQYYWYVSELSTPDNDKVEHRRGLDNLTYMKENDLLSPNFLTLSLSEGLKNFSDKKSAHFLAQYSFTEYLINNQLIKKETLGFFPFPSDSNAYVYILPSSLYINKTSQQIENCLLFFKEYNEEILLNLSSSPEQPGVFKNSQYKPEKVIYEQQALYKVDILSDLLLDFLTNKLTKDEVIKQYEQRNNEMSLNY